jgi:phosphoribosyl-ATP pyrophosphohydrolase/phosphoribosyl-AMP cyclohydrolase
MVMIDFDKQAGLIPAIIQDSRTFQVLMIGFMNQEAFEKTKNSGLVTFFSRTRQVLWTKGETSGNTLKVDRVMIDCDQDSVLILATPLGPICHNGTISCFKEDELNDLRFLGELEKTIENKMINGNIEESYTARLAAAGIKRIAQKVGEEGLEVALAAVSNDDSQLLEEAADLIYHLIVCLNTKKLSLSNVAQVLSSRS